MLPLRYCLYEKKYREERPYFEMVGVTKNVTQANQWLEGDKDNRRVGKFGDSFPIIEETVAETDSLNPKFDSIKENPENPMKSKPKKEPIKKAVQKHLKEDMKESRESIKDDKKLSKKMKKGKC